MEGLAADPVSWPWTFPNLLIDTQRPKVNSTTHSGSWFTSSVAHPHAVNFGYSCTPSCRLIDNVFHLSSNKLYGFCLPEDSIAHAVRQSRTFFLFFDYSHLKSRLNSILVIPLATWFHLRSRSVWLLLPLPYNACLLVAYHAFLLFPFEAHLA